MAASLDNQQNTPSTSSSFNSKNVTDSPTNIKFQSYSKPYQEALEKEINVMETELSCLIFKRDSGLVVDLGKKSIELNSVRRQKV